MEMELKRLLVAYSPVRQRTATSVLSLGPLHPATVGAEDVRESQSFGTSETLPALRPQISITKLTSRSKESSSVSMLSFNIPFVQVDIFKDVLDGLQFWADDVSQLMERTLSHDGNNGQVKNMDYLKTRNTAAPKSVRSRDTSEIVVEIAISDGIINSRCPFAADETFNSIC